MSVFRKPSDVTVIATVGGSGTRLYPLTLTRPKPLLSICGEAVIVRMFESLAYQNCKEFILAAKGADIVSRLKDLLKDGTGFAASAGLRGPIRFRYQGNYIDNGNGDAVRYCMNFFDIKNDVLVVGGDNLIDFSIDKLLKYHRDRKALLTVCLKKMENVGLSQFGVAEVDKNLKIKKFIEKPKPGTTSSNLVNTAVYIFSPKIRQVFGEMGDRVKDLGGDVLPYLIENNYPVYGFEVNGYWADIGTPKNFLDATQAVLSKNSWPFLLGKPVMRKKLWIHNTTWEEIKEKVKEGEIHLWDPVKIGADCKIHNNVTIRHSFIGDNVIIREGSIINNSVVMDFSYIGENTKLNGGIVGEYSRIESEAVIDRDLPTELIGDSSDLTPVVGSNVHISKKSIIGPKKRVARLKDSHKILATGRFKELGYDTNNIYFAEI